VGALPHDQGAVKMHTLLDLRGNIPSFIHVSDGKLHDVHALDLLLPEAGAIYVMDRGYVDFAGVHIARLKQFSGHASLKSLEEYVELDELRHNHPLKDVL
jgi:hypothetical protein